MNYSISVNTSKIIKDFPSYGSNSKLTPKYIIIHDTAGSSSAFGESNRLQNPNQYNDGIAHYYVDNIEAYQLVYDDVKAWHAGDGADKKGNGQSIGIEVCKSLSGGKFTSDNQKEIYLKGLDNAYKLASDLCKEYGINPKNILQHNQCSATACPYTQKVVFGSYDQALVNAENKVTEYTNSASTEQTSTVKKGLLDLKIGDIVNVKMTHNAYKMDTPNWSKAVVCIGDTYEIKDILKVKIVSTQTGADNTVSAEVIKVLDNSRTSGNDVDYNPVGNK